MDKRYKDSLIAFGMILLFTGISFAIFYPGGNGLSKFLAVLIIYYITTVFAVMGGIGTIITRPKGKFKYSFTYNFFATLNLTAGLTGLIFCAGEAGLFLVLIIANIFLGFLMYNDIYFSEQPDQSL